MELGPEYWRLLASEAFFDFGMFVFFFLYNLYLLKLGFRENFLGLMSGLMTGANIAGSILSVFAIQRFGMRRTLMASFTLVAGLSALRAVVASGPALLVLAAAAGLAFSVWPVALAPVIAAVTTEKSRARGFSYICSAGISIGIVGSLAAARLPGWITRLHWAASDIASYRASLLVGCAIVLLSLWPLARLRMSAASQPSERKLHRPNPIVLRFLIAVLVWNLGTGAFNPFASVFFARMRMPVEHIGYVFSSSQLAQVVAILFAPFFFRKFGTVRAIWGMEMATALGFSGIGNRGRCDVGRGSVHQLYGVSVYERARHVHVVDGQRPGGRAQWSFGAQLSGVFRGPSYGRIRGWMDAGALWISARAGRGRIHLRGSGTSASRSAREAGPLSKASVSSKFVMFV